MKQVFRGGERDGLNRTQDDRRDAKEKKHTQ